MSILTRRGVTAGFLPTPPTLIETATASWRASSLESDGRSLTDLTGGGRHLLMGGTSGTTPTSNDPILLEHSGTNYGFFPGGDGINYADTPDDAGYDVTNDLEIIIRLSSEDWTPPVNNRLLLSNLDTVSPRGGYELRLRPSDFELLWYQDNDALGSAASTTGIGFTDGDLGWIKVTVDVDNGASGHDVSFYTSTDTTNDPTAVSWTQLGSTVTNAGVTSIGNSGVGMSIGGISSGGSNRSLYGTIYRVVVNDGIGGTAGFDLDFTDGTATSAPYTTITAQTGQTVTMRDRTSIVTSQRLWLDGTNDWLTVPTDTVFDFSGTDSFTLVAAIRADGSGSFGNIYARGTDFEDRLQLQSNSDASIYGRFFDSNNVDSSTFAEASDIDPSTQELVVVGLVLDRGTDEFYMVKNGTAQTAVDATGAGAVSNTTDPILGANGQINGSYLETEVWGLAWYKNTVLTNSQIQEAGVDLFQDPGVTPGIAPTLIGSDTAGASLSWPGAMQVGDVAVAVVVARNSGTISVSGSGWTVLSNVDRGNGDDYVWIGYKVIDGGEGVSESWTASDMSNAATTLSVFRNVGSQLGFAYSGANATPSVSKVNKGLEYHVYYTLFDSTAINTWEASDNVTALTWDDATDEQVLTGYRVADADGTTASASCTYTAASDGSFTVTFNAG